MADTFKHEIKLFYCYARDDKSLCDELEKHLAWLKRRYQLTTWHDREILPGEEWEQTIAINLDAAHLILLLISPDFIASQYCDKEMQRALERHRTGTCRVITILLRPCYWEDAPFSSLQLLPTNANPITRWSDRDEAFQDVVTEISRTVTELLVLLKTKEEWVDEAITFKSLKRYEEALSAYGEAVRLDPDNPTYHNDKGNILKSLQRYEEALTAYEEAIRLDPNNPSYHSNKGNILKSLQRYEEALTAYEEAIRLDPDNSTYRFNKKYSFPFPQDTIR